MEEPDSPRKKGRQSSTGKNSIVNIQQQEIFLPEEKEKISQLIYEEKNHEFIKLFEDYLNYSKTSNPKLEITIAKIKNFLTRKKSLINTLNSNYSSANFLLSHLKQMYHFDKYHFVELFIFFYEFITYDENGKEYTLDKKSFLMVNSCLFSMMIKNSNHNGGDEDFERRMLKDIYKYLKKDDKLTLDSLVFYLKQLADSEITEENMFKIMDKAGNGRVSEKEVKDMIRGVEEFIVLSDESSRSHNSLDHNCSYVVESIFNQSDSVDREELIEIIKSDSTILMYLNKILEEAEEIIMRMMSSKSPSEIINLLKGKEVSNSDESNNKANEKYEDPGEEEEVEENSYNEVNECNEEQEIDQPNSFFKNSKEISSSPVFNIGEDTLSKLPYINLSSEKILSFGSQQYLQNSNKSNKLKDEAIEEDESSANMSPKESMTQEKGGVIRTNSNPEKDYARKISFGSGNKLPVNYISFPNSAQNKNLDVLKRLNINISPIVTSHVVMEGSNKRVSVLGIDVADKEREKESNDMNDNNHNLMQINVNDNHAFDFLDRESDDPLVLNVFDHEKFAKIEKIKLDTCLYDINVSDFLREFLSSKEKIRSDISGGISKPKFIDIMLNIINKYTHPLHLYSKVRALNEFYDLMNNYDLTNEMSCVEILGAVCCLCKGNVEEKINAVFDFLHQNRDSSLNFKTKFILLISGMMKLGMKQSLIKESKMDTKIIAELLYENLIYQFYEADYVAVDDDSKITSMHFYKYIGLQPDELEEKKDTENVFNEGLIFETVDSLNKNLEGVPPVHRELTRLEANPTIKLENEIFDQIMQSLEKTKHVLKIEDVSITEALNVIQNKSLIGYINKPQFIESINIIFNDFENKHGIKFDETERNEKIDLITEALQINSNNTQSFELVEIVSPLIILLKGTSDEKAISIFKLFDKEVDECISYGEVTSFLMHSFKFFLIHSELKIKDMEDFSENLARILVDDIFSFFKLNGINDGLKVKQLLEYYFLLT